MNLDNQLKLQAYLDGEASTGDARQIEKLLASDESLRQLADELRTTKSFLAGNEPQRPLPETRDFFWSQIRRQIEAEAAQKPAQPARTPAISALWRILAPVAGLAAIILAVTFSSRSLPPIVGSSEVESAEDVTAYTFRSHTDPMTAVWLAEKGADSSGLAEPNAANNVGLQ